MDPGGPGLSQGGIRRVMESLGIVRVALCKGDLEWLRAGPGVQNGLRVDESRAWRLGSNAEVGWEAPGDRVQTLDRGPVNSNKLTIFKFEAFFSFLAYFYNVK